ncbi:Thiamine-triphosphatase [Drechslerella dactyloides]|uniref:Thiamine-triphosphatase n=1 Tax=Drechslerella dactyloides TaxID=74499 RepID=A0AAD6IPW0_DREDA|nr:Thiamine-triphosphatase [Drechslerella dactyloides]
MGRIYEVERKFLFTLANAAKFYSNKSIPPFASVVFKGLMTHNDRYYDTEFYDLDRHNVWARVRNGNWQAKRLISGSHEKAVYEESKGYQSLVDTMRDLGLKEWEDLKAGNFVLHNIAEFGTERKNYIVDEKFKIVLDSTSFGYSVGEVELKGGDYEQCGNQIDEFIAKHQWFFDTTGEVKSKLKAYWEICSRQRM